MFKCKFLSLIVIFCSLSSIPRSLNYQGKLLNSSGLGINDTLDITFRLFTSQEGGSPIWTKMITDVSISRGLFSVELSDFPEEVDFSDQYYLEIQTDTEILSPREKLSSSPYAIRSSDVENAIQGVNSSENVLVRRGVMRFEADDGAMLSDTGDTITVRFLGGSSSTADFNYSVSISPTIDTVNAGFNIYPVIDLSIISGSAESISLEVTSGLPSGATATFSPLDCLPTCKSVLTIITTSETPSGTYPIIITATSSGGLIKTVTYILTITPPFDYSISLEPASSTIEQGDTTVSLITASLITGFSEDVAFSVSGLPSGAFASFNPTSCRLSCGSNMTIITSPLTPPGIYDITISGMTSGGVVRTETFILTVDYFDYSLVLTPISASISQGENTSTRIDLTTTPPVTQLVNLSLLPSPMYDGITTTLSSPSCTPDCYVTLNISTSVDVVPDTYPIDIIAVGAGGSEEIITYNLTITPFDFTFTLNPSEDYFMPTDTKTSNAQTVLVSPVTQSVSFTHSSLSSNVSLDFSMSSCNPGCTSVMTISTTGALSGTHSIDITATAEGGTIRSQTYEFQVCDTPSEPRNLNTSGTGSIVLNWDAPDDNHCVESITNYRIYRDTHENPTTLLTTVGDVLTYTDTSPSECMTYYYRVTALNSLGESVYSNQASGIGAGCTSCLAIKDGMPASTDGVYAIYPAGSPISVYCDMTTDGGGWTLVMKLSKNNFCYGSSRWTDSSPFNESYLLDTSLPNSGQYDAKSSAFYLLPDVTSLRFYTSRDTSVTVSFASPSSPRTLLTTNSIAFSPYPDFAQWRTAFHIDRAQAPIFMRAGQPVTGGPCRNNPGSTPSGCGQPCTFCYQAADGDCCPCNVTQNDVNSGVGLNSEYCGGGNPSVCSSAGNWTDPSLRVLIWAR